MPKFPVDAPKARVMDAFGVLGFAVVREGNHIAMRRPRSSGGSDCLTMPNHSTIKASTLRTTGIYTSTRVISLTLRNPRSRLTSGMAQSTAVAAIAASGILSR